jgi:hypothetical protein
LSVFRLDERFDGEQDEPDGNLDIKKERRRAVEQHHPRALPGRRKDGHEARFPSDAGGRLFIAEGRGEGRRQEGKKARRARKQNIYIKSTSERKKARRREKRVADTRCNRMRSKQAKRREQQQVCRRKANGQRTATGWSGLD